MSDPLARHRREHRRRRLRRRGRRAYIRSVYFLPSMATLGNAICGFGAIYIAALHDGNSKDPVTNHLFLNRFAYAAYLIFASMIFDALDGRLARFTRHTTDFGGQLDSLADVISFGVAPAFIALQVVKSVQPAWLDPFFTRLIWATGALYMSCAALRLARFNVSNQHGEQHHFSFLGLPSPAAGAPVASFILVQQAMANDSSAASYLPFALPFILAITGLLMITSFRYYHMINRYLRGRRSMARLIVVLIIVLLMVVAFKYTLAAGSLIYALSGPFMWAYAKIKTPHITPQ
jgi:CDP-diacylglycerol---serine O-phosphatidyltransferase